VVGTAVKGVKEGVPAFTKNVRAGYMQGVTGIKPIPVPQYNAGTLRKAMRAKAKGLSAQRAAATRLTPGSQAAAAWAKKMKNRGEHLEYHPRPTA